MLQLFLVVLVLSCAFHAHAAPAPAPLESYPDKYDNINIDDILNSRRLLHSYMQCLLDQGPCSPEGTELKKILPEALKSACAKCTEKQKAGAAKIVSKVTKDYPKEWKNLSVKWDPNGEYWAKYQPLIKEYLKT